MNTIKKTIAALAVVVATTSLVPLSASACGGDCMPPIGQHFKRMGTELGLSEKQQQGIQDICTNNRARSEQLMKQLVTERRALRTLIHAEKVDEPAIRAQSAKVAAVKADMEVQHAQTFQQIRALLTPEQAQKLKTIQTNRERRMNEVPPCGEGHHRRHR